MPRLEAGIAKNKNKKDPTCRRPVTRGRRKRSREPSEEKVPQQRVRDDNVQSEAEETPAPSFHGPSSDKEASDEDELPSDDDDNDEIEPVVEQAAPSAHIQQPALAAATDDMELFQIAADAAKHQVQGWIRAVLREVALQSMRTSIQNVATVATSNVAAAASTEEQEDDDDHSRSMKKKSRIQITLGASDIQQAASCCRLVAKTWTEQLQKVGHDLVGMWIDQVVQAEMDNLFYPPQQPVDCSSGSIARAAPASTTTTTATAHVGLAAESATATAATTTTVVAKGPQNSVAAAAAGGEATGIEVMRTTTPYARLRSLGAIDYFSWQTQPNDDTAATNVDDNDETRLDEAIQDIDRRGRMGQTYWPYSWQYIEQAAAQIPRRLYNSNTTAHLQQQVDDVMHVPSNQSQLQNSEQQQPQHEQEQDTLEWLLVNRKRKSSGKRQLPAQKRRTMLIQQQRQEQETQNDLLLPVIKRIQRQRQRMKNRDTDTNIARPATNDSGCFQWNIQEGYASFTPAEKKRLDACLHFDNPPKQQEATKVAAAAAATEPPPSILLGSLCTVGQYHYSKQRWIDDDPGKKAKKSKSEQERKETGTMTNNDNDLSRQNKEQKRQRRRQRNLQRVGMRQRLGDHSEVTVNHGVGKLRRVSKILHTTSTSSSSLFLSTSMGNTRNSNQHQQQQQQLVNPRPPEHWMDFDLGYCMFELVVDPLTGQKGLYAFESLEVMALDEDDFSDEEDEEVTALDEDDFSDEEDEEEVEEESDTMLV
jgi:hypothetical protein